MLPRPLDKDVLLGHNLPPPLAPEKLFYHRWRKDGRVLDPLLKGAWWEILFS
jgi:hypothetical protein